MRDVAIPATFRVVYSNYDVFVASNGDSDPTKHPNVFGVNGVEPKVTSLEDPYYLLNLPVNLHVNFKAEVYLLEVQTSLVGPKMGGVFMREPSNANYPSSELEESVEKIVVVSAYGTIAGTNGIGVGNELHVSVVKDLIAIRLA